MSTTAGLEFLQKPVNYIIIIIIIFIISFLYYLFEKNKYIKWIEKNILGLPEEKVKEDGFKE